MDLGTMEYQLYYCYFQIHMITIQILETSFIMAKVTINCVIIKMHVFIWTPYVRYYSMVKSRNEVKFLFQTFSFSLRGEREQKETQQWKIRHNIGAHKEIGSRRLRN